MRPGIQEHLKRLKSTLKEKLHWLQFRVISYLGIEYQIFYIQDYVIIVAR